MVLSALPSSRLLIKISARTKFPPVAANASLTNWAIAFRESSLTFLIALYGWNDLTASSYVRLGMSRNRAASVAGFVTLPGRAICSLTGPCQRNLFTMKADRLPLSD